MKKQFSRIVILLAMVVAVIGAIFAVNVPPVVADVTTDNVTKICDANPDASVCSDLKDTSGTGLSSTFKNVVNTLLYIAGIIAVVMVIISGIRMISSRGEPESVAKGRQILMYSIIGLVVVIGAFAIVNFVLGQVGGGTSSSSGGSTTCPNGQVWNATTNACESTSSTTCPSGQVWNATTNKCE